MKERLDVLLVKRNLAESREKAKAIIMSGNVRISGICRRKSLHRCRFFYRWIYRLYVAKWRGQGVCH